MRAWGRIGAASAATALVLLGCVPGGSVQRMAGDRVVSGHPVEPEAYALFLDAAEFEASQGPMAPEQWPAAVREMLKRYERVASVDSKDPAVWARIGALRCMLSPSDGGAERAFERALDLDPESEPAWAARLECAVRRGDTDLARRATAQVSLAGHASPQDEAQVAAQETDDAARARLLGVALDGATRSSDAWAQVARFAHAHHDPALEVHAWAEAVRRSLAYGNQAHMLASLLASQGRVALARPLAAAVVSAASDGTHQPFRASPLVTRLAVDDALGQGDLKRARRFALYGRLPLTAVAARALLLEDPRSARELAQEELDANPSSAAAAWVLLAVDADTRSSSHRPARVGPGLSAETLPAEVFAVAARELSRTATEAAHAFEAVPHDPATPDDALVRGALDEARRR